MSVDSCDNFIPSLQQSDVLAEAYSETRQTSKMELFIKIVNCCAKSSILDV